MKAHICLVGPWVVEMELQPTLLTIELHCLSGILEKRLGPGQARRGIEHKAKRDWNLTPLHK